MDKLELAVDVISSDVKMVSFLFLHYAPMTVIDMRDELLDYNIKKQQIYGALEKTLIPNELVECNRVQGRRKGTVREYFLTEKGEDLFDIVSLLMSFLMKEFSVVPPSVFGSNNSTTEKRSNSTKLKLLNEISHGSVSLKKLVDKCGYTPSRLQKKIESLMNIPNLDSGDVSFVLSETSYQNDRFYYLWNKECMEIEGEKSKNLYNLLINLRDYVDTGFLLEYCKFNDIGSLHRSLKSLQDVVNKKHGTELNVFDLSTEGHWFKDECLDRIQVKPRSMKDYERMTVFDYLEKIK